MQKFKNTCSTHPHMTHLLETEIYERRRRIGMSQYVLANKIGTSRNCIYLLECHDRMPKQETMFEIIEALEFTEAEKVSFIAKYMDAYNKDKKFRKEREKEPAGVI